MHATESGDLERLNAEFLAALRAADVECRHLQYSPNRFEQMLQAEPAVDLARRLVTSGELHDGLKRLARLNRLDLSLEAIMLQDRFRPLFSFDHLDAARWRLARVPADRIGPA
jgi:hypothetical protein